MGRWATPAGSGQIMERKEVFLGVSQERGFEKLATFGAGITVPRVDGVKVRSVSLYINPDWTECEVTIRGEIVPSPIPPEVVHDSRSP